MTTSVEKNVDIRERAKKARALRIRLARKDINEFCHLVMKDEETGDPVQQAPIHMAWQQVLGSHNRVLVWAHIESGKCFGKGTPILLSDGIIKPVEDIQVGDTLIGPEGGKRTVRITTSGSGPLYKIIPNKGVPWVCNDGHILTLIHTKTKEIIDIPIDEYLRKSIYFKGLYKLFRCPVESFKSEESLPIDPYFLGVWIGDGSKYKRKENLSTITVHKPDAEIGRCVKDIAEEWGLRYVYAKYKDPCPQHRVSGEAGQRNPLSDAMNELFDGDFQKIPHAIVTAPYNERAEFLAGVIDTTDGSQQNKVIEVTQKRKDYIEKIAFIARSLGLYTNVSEKVVYGNVYYRATISGDFSHIPIRIKRKIPGERKTKKSALNTGFKIEQIEDGDWFGFTLDGADGRFLLGDFTVAHNTQQISIARTLFELGNNNNLRFALVSNTKEQAGKVLSAIKGYIEQSEELKLIFPDLKKGKPWGEYRINVETGIPKKDPSIQVCGVHGNILGARIDRLGLDDILDYENCKSPTGRKDLKEWYKSTLAGRLTKKARIRCVGTAFHPDDLLHEFAKNPAWQAYRYPVIDADGNPRWPERWPLERIRQKEIELGPVEFRRQMLCEARDDSTSKFQRAWIDRCLKLGEGRSPAQGLQVVPPGYSVFTGVDLAVQRHSSADWTVLFTIAIDPFGNRHVLECISGKWSGPDIVQQIISVHHRFQSIVIVENNAAQDFILQFTRNRSAVPIRPFTTGRNKAHPDFGIEGIAAEMANGKWVIPNHGGVCHPELAEWINEMLFYDPMAHTGDRLMASWLAKEGARKSLHKVQTGRLNWLNR